MTKLGFWGGLFVLCVGCGDSGEPVGPADPTRQDEDPSSASDDADDGDADGADATDGSDDGLPADGADPGDEGDGSADGAAEGDGADGTEGDDGADQPAPTLPAPTLDCPELTDGYVMFGERRVRIYMDEEAAAAHDGPVVFYWYGTYGQPEHSTWALGSGISTITALGGIVAAPVHINSGSYPWLDASTTQQDFTLADDIIACAEQKIGIDERHIHSLGMSAGGLFSTKLSYARGYFASVAAYSGGDAGTFSDPDNKFAALVFYGGPSDNVFGKDFEAAAKAWTSTLRGAGHRALVCNHGMGHTIPPVGPAAVTQFFLDHAYGVKWAYEAGLPDAIPDYCTSE
jgi:hypothetical protein